MSRPILFVDDDFVIIESFKRKFSLLYPDDSFIYTTNPKEVISLIEEHKPIVVVSDMQMPEKNGLELFEEISEKHPHIIRYFLTGETGKESSLEFVRISDGIFLKPCKGKIIINRIKNTLINDIYPVYKRKSSLICKEEVLDILIENKGAETKELAELLITDPLLSLKALQCSTMFANSKHLEKSYHQKIQESTRGVFKKICSLERCFLPMNKQRRLDSGVEIYFEKSCELAKLSSRIASELMDEKKVEQAYFAGLFSYITEICALKPNSFEDSSWVHIWLGDIDITNAIRYHKSPINCDSTEISPLTALHLASALQGNCDLDTEYFKKINMNTNLDQWRKYCESSGTI